MNQRPIGFFDSGLGGLTCVPALKKLLPNERVIYFGDTARTPYGSKSPDTIRHFALDIVKFLQNQGVKAVAIACNTVTAVALDFLREKCPGLPIIGVIDPVAQEMAQRGEKLGKVGVIGTRVTVESAIYEKRLQELNPSLEVRQKACPLFVHMIEEGLIGNPILDMTIHHYLDEFVEHENLDELILGCTHYHLLEERIAGFYPELKVINPSEAMAREIKSVLERDEQLAAPREEGQELSDLKDQYYASDLSDTFIKMIEEITKGEKAEIHFQSLEHEWT